MSPQLKLGLLSFLILFLSMHNARRGSEPLQGKIPLRHLSRLPFLCYLLNHEVSKHLCIWTELLCGRDIFTVHSLHVADELADLSTTFMGPIQVG
jgi:hypothetical protein